MCLKGRKENLNLQAVTVVNPIMGWFKVAEYNNKHEITIINLVDTTLLTRYPWTTEITHDQGSKFIRHEVRKSLIEK